MRKGHIYTTGKSKTFQLQYDVLGKRTRRSLRTSDPLEAKKRAEAILGRIKLLSTRQEYLQALVKMGEEASRELKQISQRPECIFLQDAFDTYFKSSRRPVKANNASMNRYFSYTQELRKTCNNIDYVAQIDDYAAECYMRHLEKTNSASTVTMKLNWFKLLWNTLQVTPNPWEGLRTTKKGDAKPWRRFTHEECVNLYGVAHGEKSYELKILTLLGYYTGQRLRDCCLLTWGSYFPGLKNLSIKAGKTGKTCHVPVINELLEFFMACAPYDYREDACIIPNVARMYVCDPSSISRIVTAQLKTIGIKENGSKVGFHSFRKTFVSMMDEAGAPVFVTNSITGHDAGGMHARYSQTDVETARHWMEKALPPLKTLDSAK